MSFQFSVFSFQRRSRAWVTAVIGHWSLVIGYLAQASDVPLTPIEELARRADDVVRGRVVSLEATRDEKGRPFTRVEVGVAECWKGAATNQLTVVLAGTVLGERRVLVVGEPEFLLDEEVVLFAVRNPRGEAVTLDLARGKFLVTTNAVTGGLEAANRPVKGGAAMPGFAPLELGELKRRVSKALE